jgi:hypothetical protein
MTSKLYRVLIELLQYVEIDIWVAEIFDNIGNKGYAHNRVISEFNFNRDFG